MWVWATILEAALHSHYINRERRVIRRFLETIKEAKQWLLLVLVQLLYKVLRMQLISNSSRLSMKLAATESFILWSQRTPSNKTPNRRLKLQSACMRSRQKSEEEDELKGCSLLIMHGNEWMMNEWDRDVVAHSPGTTCSAPSTTTSLFPFLFFCFV